MAHPASAIPQPKTVLRVLFDWVWPIGMGVLIAETIVHYLMFQATVPSGSMYPTIPVNPSPPPGQTAQASRILVDKLPVDFGRFYRGEVVVFRYPDDPSTDFVKRIIGLPGDTVVIRSGHVFINGHRLKEPYLTSSYGNTEGTFGPFQVPKDSYFMLGDNRNDSWDSRFWTHKFVSRAAIIGRADMVVWPLNDVHLIPQ